MTDRDRLIELLQDSEIKYAQYLYEKCDKAIKGDITEQLFKRLEFYADYLLANGVIVPSFKIGDKVYQTDAERVYELDITDVYFYKKWIYETKSIDFDIGSIGKSIFLTKEEAEAELRKRNEENVNL
jgi:hypothetical protein